MARDIIEKYPFPFERADAQALLDVLVQHYSTEPSTMALVLKVAPELVKFVHWSQPMYLVWYSIAAEATHLKIWPQLIATIQADPRAKLSIGPRIGEILSEQTPALPARAAEAKLNWVEPDAGVYEKVLGDESTLLDTAFLKRALVVGGAVARLQVRNALGTGFRIGEDLVLTNHHVAYSHGKPMSDVAVQFHFETDPDSGAINPINLRGNTIEGNGDARRDWAVIRIRPEKPIPKDIPILSITGAAISEKDRVCIIQHPSGLPKRIGMHHNLVTFVDDDVIQYLTDTEAGSSGSPVFNADWKVVGLHHKWLRTDVASALDGTQRTEYRNQCIRIERVRVELVARGFLTAQ